MKFWRVEEPERSKLESEVSPPVAVSVDPIASEPVRFAVLEIVCPLMRPVVTAPSVVAPATLSVPPIVVLPVLSEVEKRLVELAVVEKKLVEVALVVVEFPVMTKLALMVEEALDTKPLLNLQDKLSIADDEAL